MIDPLPLTQAGATPFETLLLSAGRSDALSSQSRARIQFGLGLGGGALVGSVIATGLKATAAKSSLLSGGSTAVISAVGAVALFFGARNLLEARPAEVEPRSQPSFVADPPRLSSAPAVQLDAPAAAPPITERSEPKLPVGKPNARAVLPGNSLANELDAIEDARRALSRREYALSLRLLDEYAQRFPKRTLRSEATLLRIETLAASGAMDAAHQLGKVFLANHPNGPYARRVRSLLSDAATANER